MYLNDRVGFFLKGCFLLLMTTQVSAGYYGGAEIGGLRSSIKTYGFVVPGGTYFDYTTDAPQIAEAGKHRMSEWDFTGGVFGGYNFLFNHILTGIEVSVNSLLIDKTASTEQAYFSLPTSQFVFDQSLKANWQGTLRLRLGLVKNCWLAYLTGGAAMTQLKLTSSFVDDNAQPGSGLPGAHGSGTASNTKFGWIVGAGSEYAVNDNWAIKLQYLYAHYGSVRTIYTLIPTPTLSEFTCDFNANAHLITQSLLMGLTYHF